MSRQEALNALKSNTVDATYIIRQYLIDKYPDKDAVYIQEILDNVLKNPGIVQLVVRKCLEHFEEKLGIMKVFNKNQKFICYV